MIPRRKTTVCQAGSLKIGNNYPIAIQSMANIPVFKTKKLIAQIHELEKEGCEMIRIALPNLESTEEIPEIKKKICLPLIGDIHFDYRIALFAIKKGIDKIRINPGNISDRGNVKLILKSARKNKVAVRLGVNSGSLEQDLLDKYKCASAQALVASALRWIKFFESNDFTNFVVSVKSSDVIETVKAYQLLAKKCSYPFHIGITEAGAPPQGVVKSAIGIGSLLLQGIGDTIRASLTVDPVFEVKLCKMILKSLHLYKKELEIIACPTCGRTEIKLIELVKKLEQELSKIKKPLKISVMGCCVNALEAKSADFGIIGGKKKAALLRKGKIIKWVPEEKLISEFLKIITPEASDNI